MSPLDQLLAKQACVELMTAYCTHLDARSDDAFVALFEPQAVMRKLYPPGVIASGHAEIAQSLQARPPSLLSRHLLANTAIHLIDADNARGEAFGMVVRGTRDRETWPMPIRGLELLVSYAMTFHRSSQGWRIRECAVGRIMDIDAPPLPAPTA